MSKGRIGGDHVDTDPSLPGKDGITGSTHIAQGANETPIPAAEVSEDEHEIEREAYLLWRDSPEYSELMRKLALNRSRSNKPDESGKPSWYVVTAYVGFVIVIICLLVIAVLTPIIASLSDGSAPRTVLLSVDALFAIIAIGAIIIVGFKYAAARRAYYERIKRAKEHYVDYAVNQLGTGAGATLEKLLVLNRRQLDDYHLSSTRQQSIAFRNAQIAAVVGLIVLVMGAILATRQSSDTARYVAAGISALGAALSAYIARTFFALSRNASMEMKRYYQEPFKTHDILMIERIADPKKNDRLRKAMVGELLKIVDRHSTDNSSPNGSEQTDEGKGQGDKGRE